MLDRSQRAQRATTRRQQSYAEFNAKDIKVFYWILVLDGKPYYIGYLDDSEASKKENSFFTPP